MKKVYIICPTFRDNTHSKLREIGILDLIHQTINKSNLYLCIIDSSKYPLKLFNDLPVINNNIIYLHVPSKKVAIDKYANTFPYAMNFCITKNHNKFDYYLNIVDSWSKFVPWDDNFPHQKTLKDHFLASRPSIGMKRNMAIAALEETFGNGDIICYADDDDFRSKSYFHDMIDYIADNDFIRISKWLTCCFNTSIDNSVYGLYDIPFIQDVNGFFHLKTRDTDILYNSRNADFCNFSVKEHYSKIKNMAFSPMSYDGAVHVFSKKLWVDSIDAFGGITPVSLGEDTCFFKSCQNYFGSSFKYNMINNKKLNFIRCANNNASLIQWTENIALDDMPKWAQSKIIDIYRLLNSEQELKKRSTYIFKNNLL